jgi:hypothetical protein
LRPLAVHEAQRTSSQRCTVPLSAGTVLHLSHGCTTNSNVLQRHGSRTSSSGLDLTPTSTRSRAEEDADQVALLQYTLSSLQLSCAQPYSQGSTSAPAYVRYSAGRRTSCIRAVGQWRADQPLPPQRRQAGAARRVSAKLRPRPPVADTLHGHTIQDSEDALEDDAVGHTERALQHNRDSIRSA